MGGELVFEAVVPGGVACGIEPGAVEASSFHGDATFNALLVETPDGFEVCDIIVGGEAQFADKGPVPAAAFTSTSGVRIALDPIGRETSVALRVRNFGAEPRVFRARLQALPPLPVRQGSSRELPLGFHGMVKAGETAEITSKPDLNFAPERLIVPSTVASAFRIVNVLSDGKGAMPEPIEASLVTEDHNQAALSEPLGHPWPRRVCEGLPVCKKGRPMTLVVKNTSATPQAFIAALIGDAPALGRQQS